MITVSFDSRSRKFEMAGSFSMVDVLRSFPSRRFDPKSKKWKAPLVKANVAHMISLRERGLATLDVSAEAAVRDMERLVAAPVEVPIPREYFRGQKFQPMEHQWEMLDRGYGLRAYALFAAMGTGKTFTTIAMAMARHAEGKIKRLMIISPQTLRPTWQREFGKYADEKQYDLRFHATGKFDRVWVADDSPLLKVLLVGIEALGISKAYWEDALPFVDGETMVVCDESSRIKNPDAMRTKRAIELALPAAYRMILNGTPIAKGIQDLWSQYEFLDTNIIGTGDYWAFKSRYLQMGGFELRQIVGYQNLEELMATLKPYTLEVNKAVLNLPSKIMKTRIVAPTPEQKALFKQIVDGFGPEPMIKVQNVLERCLRLQQVIGGFQPMTDETTMETTTKPLDKNPKLDALRDVIDENFEGSKFIIWARYIPEIRMIVDILREVYGPNSVVDYYGSTTSEDRQEAERRYCSDPKCRFLVGNPSAAGLGLTLISGENDVMIYYSGTFAYIDRTQSEDRAHRIGQRNSMAVLDLVMEGTLDETIQASIREKKDVDVYVKEQMSRGVSVRGLVSGRQA